MTSTDQFPIVKCYQKIDGFKKPVLAKVVQDGRYHILIQPLKSEKRFRVNRGACYFLSHEEMSSLDSRAR